MKAMFRLFIVIGLYLGLMHGVSARQAIDVDPIVSSGKDTVKTVLIKSVKIDEVIWLFVQAGPRYTVFTAKDSGQSVARAEIRDDGSVITVRTKNGDETTFFVPDMKLSRNKFFQINWKRLSVDDLLAEAKLWNLRV